MQNTCLAIVGAIALGGATVEVTFPSEKLQNDTLRIALLCIS